MTQTYFQENYKFDFIRTFVLIKICKFNIEMQPKDVEKGEMTF